MPTEPNAAAHNLVCTVGGIAFVEDRFAARHADLGSNSMESPDVVFAPQRGYCRCYWGIRPVICS
jgi:hypothetical protein